MTVFNLKKSQKLFLTAELRPIIPALSFNVKQLLC